METQSDTMTKEGQKKTCNNCSHNAETGVMRQSHSVTTVTITQQQQHTWPLDSFRNATGLILSLDSPVGAPPDVLSISEIKSSGVGGRDGVLGPDALTNAPTGSAVKRLLEARMRDRDGMRSWRTQGQS